jgi:hypothetical protein
MSPRLYPWAIFVASLASIACLLLSDSHYAGLMTARGWSHGSMGTLLAIVPGALICVFWMFQSRPWLRRAGLIAAVGALVFSAIALLRALVTDRLSGDMSFMVVLDGAVIAILTIAWSIVSLGISWVLDRSEARQ